MERRAFLRSGLAAGVVGLAPRPLAAQRLRTVTTPRAARPDGTIRLSSNENPIGLSPAARSAILEGLVDANRYPHNRAPLIAAIAAKHHVSPEHVVLGSGSTEVLKMAVDAFAMPDGHLVVAQPTYEDAPWYSQAGHVRLTPVPLTADGAHDLDRMRAAVASGRGRALVYICNPNNPTGTLTPSSDVDAWIAKADPAVTFLVDEAYFEFVDSNAYHSAEKWVTEHPNVIVTRTFSKVFGMAGVRLGYGLAHPDTAQRLDRRHLVENVNQLALVAGTASIGDTSFVQQSLESNRRGRQIAYACLRELDLSYFETHTNFIMHQIRGSLDAYITHMRDAGLRVGRPFPPMLDHNRVSIGLPREMERWAETLRGFRRRGWV